MNKNLKETVSNIQSNCCQKEETSDLHDFLCTLVFTDPQKQVKPQMNEGDFKIQWFKSILKETTFRTHPLLLCCYGL